MKKHPRHNTNFALPTTTPDFKNLEQKLDIIFGGEGNLEEESEFPIYNDSWYENTTLNHILEWAVSYDISESIKRRIHANQKLHRNTSPHAHS